MSASPAARCSRFQRPLSFGGVLDETFRLYRTAWVKLWRLGPRCAASAVAVVLLTGQIYVTVLNLPAVPEDDPGSLLRLVTGIGLGGLLASIVSGVGDLSGRGRDSHDRGG